MRLFYFTLLFFPLSIFLYAQIPPHGNFKIDLTSDRFYYYAKGNTLLWSSTSSWILYYSKDGGNTIINSYNFHDLKQVPVWRAFLCSNGNIIVVSDSTIYYSTDDGRSFNSALDKATGEPAKCLYWNNPNSIDEGNGIIMFGDYGPDGPHPGDGTMTKSIWKSDDFGVTWDKILTEVHDPTGQLPGSIRHFHTCEYNKNSDAWFVTTGDWNIQIKWLISTDQGNSWYQVDSTQSQMYRTITPKITDSNKIIWGTDNTDSQHSNSGVFSVDWYKLFNTSRSLTQLYYLTDAEIYNLWIYNGQIMFTDRVDAGTVISPDIYYSPDMGNSWQKVMDWPRTDSNEGGFWQGCGVDDSGRVFLPLAPDMQGYPNIWGITFIFPEVQQVSPLTNSVGNIQPVQLKWMSFSGASNYRVQLSIDSTFATIIVDTTGYSDTTFSLSDLNNLTTYYWRVSAMSKSGMNIWSSVCNFKTISNPTQAILVYPSGNSVNIPLTVNFMWNRFQDQLMIAKKNTFPKGVRSKTKIRLAGIKNVTNVSQYWFELTTDTTSSGYIIDDSTLSDTTRQVTGLQNLTSYWWRVRAMNEAGWGTYADWSKFTTITDTPGVAVLLSPNISQNISDTTLSILFKWRSALFASTYNLQIASNNKFDNVLIDTSGITDTVFFYHTKNLALTFCWRVRGNNVAGTGSWSTASTIPLITQATIKSSIPAAYELYQNYPNPFNPGTYIMYALPKESFVSIKVYDVLGRKYQYLKTVTSPRVNIRSILTAVNFLQAFTCIHSRQVVIILLIK